MKDRKQTEEDILNALDSLIKHKGFKAVGINSVAKEAGVSKVLIYRYFENLDGLLEVWAEKNNYWTETRNSDLASVSTSKLVKSILNDYLQLLRNDPQRRELLRWLITEDSSLGKKIMEKMEESGLGLTNHLKTLPEYKKDVDIEAILALATAGISYLALISEKSEIFNGVELNSDSGWKRIEKILNLLVDISVDE